MQFLPISPGKGAIMKLITRDTDYALKSLCYLAKQNGRVVSVNELTSQLHIPRAFLRKVLQTLTQKGHLRSYKGQGGGFSLSKPPGKICVTDVMSIFQRDWNSDTCFIGKEVCPDRATCLLRKKLALICGFVTGQLHETSLKELITS